MNLLNRRAKYISSASNDLYTTQYFMNKNETVIGIITGIKLNGITVFIPQYNIKGDILLISLNEELHPLKLLSQNLKKSESSILIDIDMDNQVININNKKIYLLSPIIIQLSCIVKDITYRMPLIHYELYDISVKNFHPISHSNEDIEKEYNKIENNNNIKNNNKLSLYDIMNLNPSDIFISSNKYKKEKDNISIITEGRYITNKMEEYCIYINLINR